MNALPKVNCFTAIGNGFKNYINFSGRIRRSEYWFFMLLINFITFFLLLLFILYVTRAISRSEYKCEYNYSYDPYYQWERKTISYCYYNHYMDYNGYFGTLITLSVYVGAIMLPTLSATVRRLHDTGKRGEYIFIALVPFFGHIALLVLLCTDSMKETNEFGPSPKYTNAVNNYLLAQPQIQNVSAPAVAPLQVPLIQTNVSPVPMNMMNNNVNNMMNNNVNNMMNNHPNNMMINNINNNSNNNIIDNKINVKNKDYSNV